MDRRRTTSRRWCDSRHALQVAGAIALAVWLVSCSGKEASTPTAPVGASPVTLSGNVAHWTTASPARGWVRYGFAAGRFDHAAYPAAAGREDRRFTTTHAVPLLDLAAGRKLYLQAISESGTGGATQSAVDTFTATLSSPGAIFTSTMIHIGFGDSHLLTMPGTHERVLIDAGPRSAARSVVEYMGAHGVDHLDAMLATHVHLDHMGGMVGTADTLALLSAEPPAVFFDSPTKTFHKSAYDEALALLAASPATTRVIIHRGDTSASVPALQFDPLVDVLVLNASRAPDVNLSGYEGTDINNESIVLRFSYGDVDMIIGGDAEDQTTASILKDYAPAQLDVEFYKAQHHGLSDANSVAWINALQPRVAFIPNTDQVWDGNLSDALAVTTGRLQSVGAHIYAIDDVPTLREPRGSGAQHNVTFATDGVSYEVRSELATQSTAVGSQEQACASSEH